MASGVASGKSDMGPLMGVERRERVQGRGGLSGIQIVHDEEDVVGRRAREYVEEQHDGVSQSPRSTSLLRPVRL